MNLVSGLGTGILFPSMGLAIQASSTNEDQGYAVNIFSFLRVFGQTVGVAIGGVIFQNQMKKKLLTFPLLAGRAAEYSKDASGLVEIIKVLPDESLEKMQLRSAYTDAIHYVYMVMMALSAVAMIASFWTEGLPLDRKLETEQGFQHQVKMSDEEKDSTVRE